jgi:hypothetical protein
MFHPLNRAHYEKTHMMDDERATGQKEILIAIENFIKLKKYLA